MNVPLLDLGAHHAPLQDRILETIRDVVKENRYILGPRVERLEKRIAEYCGVRHAIGVSSGSDALLLALMTLDIGPGAEVIVPAYSFFATAGVVSRLRAKPVFVDIDPVTYNIDPDRLEAAFSPRTRAVLPVHLYGQCADMKPILELAGRKGADVIEDAAQAIGAEYPGGKRAGAMGTFGCLSFFPTKNLGGLGDGGMLLTDDPALAEKARILRVHGAKPKYHHKLVGGNFRLDALQAAVLDVKLEHLDSWTSWRQRNAQRYAELFGKKGLTEIKLPAAVYRDKAAGFHIYNQFVIEAPERDALRAHLKERGVGTEVYYPVPFHTQECFKDLGHSPEDFPVSKRAAERTLALPIYPELSKEQQAHVVDSIADFFAGKGGS